MRQHWPVDHVANRIDAGDVGLVIQGIVYPDGIFLDLKPPFGNGPQLRGEPEKGDKGVRFQV